MTSLWQIMLWLIPNMLDSFQANRFLFLWKTLAMHLCSRMVRSVLSCIHWPSLGWSYSLTSSSIGFRPLSEVSLWIYIEFFMQACLVDSQGSDWRHFVHAHDLSGTIHYGVRFRRLPGGRIRCHLQAFFVALSCLLLIGLDRHDLSC